MEISYNILIPKADGAKNYNALNPTLNTRIDWSESEIYLVLDFVNEYLWFIIIVVVFFALIYTWIKIITNEESEKTTVIKDFVYGIAWWLLVAIFSYAVVRIIINFL